MSEHLRFLKVGLSKTKVISILGEPDEVKYVQVSFRPPRHGEAGSAYQDALNDWEEQTVGEVMIYDVIGLEIELSKAGRLIRWHKGSHIVSE